MKYETQSRGNINDKNISGAIVATHISSDKLNLISSEHTMSDQLTIKASPHHRGVVTAQVRAALGAAYNAGARVGVIVWK